MLGIGRREGKDASGINCAVKQEGLHKYSYQKPWVLSAIKAGEREGIIGMCSWTGKGKQMYRVVLAGVAHLVGTLSPKLKDCGFDSWSGHMPRLQVLPPVRVHTRGN